MIAAPRVWVKNKKAHMVRNGKVVPAFKLFFGSGGRILVAPDAALRFYAYLPSAGNHNVVACESSSFRYLKIIAWGSTEGCAPLPSGASVATPLKLAFTADDGAMYEVSWEADVRR
jgi:hypothetical protein